MGCCLVGDVVSLGERVDVTEGGLRFREEKRVGLKHCFVKFKALLG